MSKNQKVIPEKCANYKGEESSKFVKENDAILYALGVGCSKDPMNKDDLTFTYELDDNFQVLPTMGQCSSLDILLTRYLSNNHLTQTLSMIRL